VQVAQAEVNDALAAVERAQADLNLSYVRAPIDGQILEIYTQPGEIVSSQGIAALARTEQMYAIAEIYDTDIAKVRVGQPATITSEAFSGAIEGTVAQIGLQVGQQDIFSVNPLADTDRKVIEVKIRIDDPEARERIANLTNLQVQVAIHI
jgi:HlyD family secretion protein